MRYLVERLQYPRSAARHALDKQTLIKLVAIFFRLRTWVYSACGSCLFDSLVLADFLTRFGAQPVLVLGVHTKPFAAHAWVQCGPWVLNDTVENVEQFVPILRAGCRA
jgi:hypothetical protein